MKSVSPDPLALHDDLTHAAGLIAAGPDAGHRRYLAGFLSGLARSAHDAALENAAHDATGPAGFERLSGLVTARIEHAPDAIDSPVETARLAGLAPLQPFANRITPGPHQPRQIRQPLMLLPLCHRNSHADSQAR